MNFNTAPNIEKVAAEGPKTPEISEAGKIEMVSNLAITAQKVEGIKNKIDQMGETALANKLGEEGSKLKLYGGKTLEYGSAIALAAEVVSVAVITAGSAINHPIVIKMMEAFDEFMRSGTNGERLAKLFVIGIGSLISMVALRVGIDKGGEIAKQESMKLNNA
ncbi:MAG: hypothetical protein WCW65_01125 [Candidatus Paceibacterota bacterium]